MYNVKDN